MLGYLFSDEGDRVYNRSPDTYIQGRKELLNNSALKGGNTISADELSLEYRNIVGISAEYAGGLILFKNDLIIVYKNLNGVLCLNVKCIADFDREYDSSELVDFSYNAC